MREIEILVKVLESKKSALKKLSRFRIDHISNIADQYYYIKDQRGFLPTRNKSATEMLRVRKKDGKSYITYKKDVFTKTRWAYADEHETEIIDAKVVSDILEKLGFKPLVKVINKRTICYYKEFEICIEEVKGLGLFLEIECIKPGKKNSEKVREDIITLIRNIGIKVSDEMSMGKGELMYRKKHKI